MANVLTNVGREIITGLLAAVGSGPGSAVPKYVGWGTGAGTSAATDTTLFTEDSGGSPSYARVTCTLTQQTTSVTNDTFQAVGTIVSNGSHTITNAGLFDAGSSGNLFIKGDFSGVALTSGEAIQFTIQYQVT